MLCARGCFVPSLHWCPVSTIHRFSLLVLLCCLVQSCGNRKVETPVPPPAAYFPELFDDIPLPMFYTRKHASDQVAASFAGGNLRHLDITLEEVEPESKAYKDQELLDWYDTALISNGWVPVVGQRLPKHTRQYKKTHKSLNPRTELLELRTGRDQKLSIIRLRFIR